MLESSLKQKVGDAVFNWQLKCELKSEFKLRKESSNLLQSSERINLLPFVCPCVDLWGIEPGTFLKLSQDLAGTTTAKMYCRHFEERRNFSLRFTSLF